MQRYNCPKDSNTNIWCRHISFFFSCHLCITTWCGDTRSAYCWGDPMCRCTGDNVFWFLFSRCSVVMEKLYRFKSPNITIYTSSSVAIMRIHGCCDDLDPHMISLTTLGVILPWWSVPGLMYTKGCVCVWQYGREYRTNIDFYAQPRPVVCWRARAVLVWTAAVCWGHSHTLYLGHYLASVFVSQNLEWNLHREKL